MRIAVIGSGVAGLGAALALSEDHDVRLFEQDTRFGGHANTLDLRLNGRCVAVDTGFIVYNERNYPNLRGLFDHLGVATKWSDMSFGFSLNGGRMEWSGDGLDTVFAQRLNLARPGFVRGVLDILRFNRLAAERLEDGGLAGLSLGRWLEMERFSAWLRDCYVLPMGGAIWSTPIAGMLDFPAESFLSFFRNHDLLGGLEARQRWRTVDGGSRNYVRPYHPAARAARDARRGRSAHHPARRPAAAEASPTARRRCSTRWFSPAMRRRRWRRLATRTIRSAPCWAPSARRSTRRCCTRTRR